MGVGFGLGWGWGIVRPWPSPVCVACTTGLTTAARSVCYSQGWGSKIINTKQAFPRKVDNLLESAQAAAADAMSVLQGGKAGAQAKAA